MRVILGFVLCLFSLPALAGAFSLSSPQVANGTYVPNQQVYSGFGCTGGNTSPALSWLNPPAGTKSFAITVYDPDAPTGSGWWHWVIFNIPATVTSLPAGAGNVDAQLAPADAVQSRNDYGTTGYGGPCPPVGDTPHRYLFTVYALNVDKLPLTSDAMPEMVGYSIHQHMLGSAQISALYGR
jgi:Raf kinase inhibitor-like YbhB/YbcL family protein